MLNDETVELGYFRDMFETVLLVLMIDPEANGVFGFVEDGWAAVSACCNRRIINPHPAFTCKHVE